jgi:hypothetical protein
MLAIIAYGTALFGTAITFALLWWLYRHERAAPAITEASVAALVADQYPGFTADAVAFSADGGCALLAGGADGEALVLPVGHHLVFWRLSPGSIAAALDKRGADGALTIRTGDLTRPSVTFRPDPDFQAFALHLTAPAPAAVRQSPHQELAA